MSPPLLAPVTAAGRASCTASDVLRRVGGKWSVLLMGLLAERPRGFNELDRAVPGLSRRILSLTLQGLVRDGLVSRTGAARRVDYALSGLGRSLLPLIIEVGRWAETNHDEIQRARADYDQSQAPPQQTQRGVGRSSNLSRPVYTHRQRISGQ